MTTYHFILPLPSNRANARAHWRQVHRERKHYHEALGAIHLTGHSLQYPERRNDFRTPQAPPEPHDNVTAKATLYLWSTMDQDNALARLKWPVDWICEAGYVVDDSPEHWTWEGVPEQEIDRKAQRVEITLTADTESGGIVGEDS